MGRTADFETVEAARDFIQYLKESFGRDEIVAKVCNMRALLPPPPTQSCLPGAAEWPLQRRPAHQKGNER